MSTHEASVCSPFNVNVSARVEASKRASAFDTRTRVCVRSFKREGEHAGLYALPASCEIYHDKSGLKQPEDDISRINVNYRTRGCQP